MGTTATAHDFWRLADQAERNGIRIMIEPFSNEHIASSASDPTRLYRVTAHSCTCKGFQAWQRCQHHALLLKQLGWLPDPEPEPPAPASAAAGQSMPSWASDHASGVGETPAPSPLAFAGKHERAAALLQTVDAAVERLAEQLAEGHTTEFERALSFFGRFHKYSARNCLLILAQCPQASLVAGMRRWNELGYGVRSGEKAIWIWAPIIRRGTAATDDTTEDVERVVGFRPAPVFDASQLAGLDAKPLPSLTPTLPDDVQPLVAHAIARIAAQGIVVEERALPVGVDGASTGGAILLRPGLDSRTGLFVLLHELAHELAHQGPDQRQKPIAQREREAEATSFVVAAALGLDHPGSRDYLLQYQATPEQLRASLGTIQTLSRRILALIDASGMNAVARAA